MEWNINGFAARWKIYDDLQDIQKDSRQTQDPDPKRQTTTDCAKDTSTSIEQDKQEKIKIDLKMNKKISKNISLRKGDLRQAVIQAENPDVLVFLESKIDVKKLLKLQDFQMWCRTEG